MKYAIPVKLLMLMFIVSQLSACQSMNAAVGGYLGLDTDLQIDIAADADINPDELGKASPLFVRMYELKSTKMINKADFISIYERDTEILGADMVNVQRLKRLKPGESRTEHFVLNKETNYVALYAEFLNFKRSGFKVIIPVVASNVVRNTVKVRVSGNKLIIDSPIEESLADDNYKDFTKICS